MNIHLHIERLMLDGPPANGEAPGSIQLALERELTRLLGERNTISLRGHSESLNAPIAQTTATSQRTSVGEQIAGSVHAALSVSTRNVGGTLP